MAGFAVWILNLAQAAPRLGRPCLIVGLVSCSPIVGLGRCSLIVGLVSCSLIVGLASCSLIVGLGSCSLIVGFGSCSPIVGFGRRSLVRVGIRGLRKRPDHFPDLVTGG